MGSAELGGLGAAAHQGGKIKKSDTDNSSKWPKWILGALGIFGSILSNLSAWAEFGTQGIKAGTTFTFFCGLVGYTLVTGFIAAELENEAELERIKNKKLKEEQEGAVEKGELLN